jgi:hypothetical protein
VTISEAQRMNEAIFAALADPEPLFWRPQRRAIKVGKTWHVWLAIPRLTPDGEDFLRDLVVRGTGRTIRAAESDMRRRLNRHGRLYRLALTIDLRARAVGTVSDWTRKKMKEDGIIRRILPSIGDFMQRKMREDSFIRRIVPPLDITNAELDAAIAADPPVKQVDGHTRV